MARSRNIKPGFFLNDELAEIEPLGRLLFAGLWCIADREGRLDDRPKKIKAEVLPYDECNVDNLLQQLHDHHFITRYEVEGNRYIQINNFAKHQNPHIREPKSTIPAPPSNISAPDLHHTNTVQAPEENRTGPADSLNLIPDSLNLDPDPEEAEAAATAPEPEHPGLSQEEREGLKILKSITNYPFDFLKDLALLRALEVDFPEISLVPELKKFQVQKMDKPLKKKSNPRLQVRNWIEQAEKWRKEKQYNGRSPTGWQSTSNDPQELSDWEKRLYERTRQQHQASNTGTGPGHL